MGMGRDLPRGSKEDEGGPELSEHPETTLQAGPGEGPLAVIGV